MGRLQNISSTLSALFKFVVPTSVLAFIVYKLMHAFYFDDVHIDFIGYMVAAVGFVVSIFYARTKKVSVDDDFIYVSNYLKSLRLPITEIEGVRSARGVRNPETIWVTFQSETKFGREIHFIPKMRLIMLGEHPIATDLKNRAQFSKDPGK